MTTTDDHPDDHPGYDSPPAATDTGQHRQVTDAMVDAVAARVGADLASGVTGGPVQTMVNATDPGRVHAIAAEAFADLEDLQAVMDLRVGLHGRDHAAVAFTQELLNHPSWDRVMLASVLAAALAAAAGRVREPAS